MCVLHRIGLFAAIYGRAFFTFGMIVDEIVKWGIALICFWSFFVVAKTQPTKRTDRHI